MALGIGGDEGGGTPVSVSPTLIVQLTDKLTAWYLAAKSALGDGTSGVSQKATDVQTIVLQQQSYGISLYLLTGSESLRRGSLADKFAATTVANFLDSLNRLAASYPNNSIQSLDSYATYFNLTDTTKWQCLFAPDFRTLYGLWANGTYPTAWNVYFEVLQGATYPYGLRRLIVGSGQTAGYDIDENAYAGGFPQLKWSSVTGSGTVTVSGVWRKSDGTIATGDGTRTVSTSSGSGSITPPFTNALILHCTNISVSGITAGTFYVEAVRPSGRSNPPT